MAIIAPDIGIDLGTSNTLVYVKHKGVVLNEPTLMVVTGGQKKSVKAFGEDARLMLGRTTGEYQSVRPLEDGVIKDYDMTEYMLEFFIRKAIGMSRLVRPRGLITIPSRVTAIERRAVREAAENAGIRKGALHLIEKPFAAALGSGLPVFDRAAHGGGYRRRHHRGGGHIAGRYRGIALRARGRHSHGCGDYQFYQA